MTWRKNLDDDLAVRNFLYPNWTATIAVGLLAIAGIVVVLFPLVVIAFKQYDVARDSPP